MLSISDLRAGYGASEVLHSVSVHVDEGEVVALLGPNGHGKTTLLRTISGLVTPTAGSVHFHDLDLLRMTPDEIVSTGVVHIPQGDLPFPAMSVNENLLMGAYVSAAWKTRKEALERVYGLFPRLAERKGQLARSLSGGERRMLALGRGLMAKARLLLVDEPSLGLAPRIIEDVYGMIREIASAGMSILLVDENAQHIEGLANRVYVMEAGHIVLEGPAQNLVHDEALLSAYLG
jgi:branched-chain amino acid transport system ATP-binding protein